ncbi:MAG: hypothetical protein AABY01_00460 [Nanoarchaeota archaeon]
MVPETNGKRKLLFTLDEETYAAITKVQKECNYDMPAGVVRDALTLYFGIREQAKEGFHEITLKNPKTGEERVLVDSHLEILLKTYFPKG